MRSTPWSHLLKGLILIQVGVALGIYEPVREYAGPSFFSQWDFHPHTEETTCGKLFFVDRNTSMQKRLTYVDPSTGRTITRVDDTVKPESGSPAVRITLKDAYPAGSLIIIDATCLPYGNPIRPVLLRMLGTRHADGMNLIEGITMSSTNPDCTQPLDTDSEQPIRSTGGSCKSQETNLESCGENLAKADGGMFAVQINVSEVSTWFWSRSDIPDSIPQARPDTNIDVSDWGTPSAIYPVAEEFLDEQELALEIVSCDQWSRTSQVHTETCFGKCASNAIAGRSDYGNAYWEISYIRVFSRTVTEPEPLFKLARKAFTTSSSDMDTTTSTLVLAAPGRTFGIFDPSISSTSSSISLETNTEISTTLTVTPTSSPESTTISDTSTPLGFDTGSKYESDTREATLATFDMFDPTTDATSVVTLTSGTLITVTSVSNAEIITTDSTTTIRPTSLAASLHHSATIWNSFLLYIILRTLVML